MFVAALASLAVPVTATMAGCDKSGTSDNSPSDAKPKEDRTPTAAQPSSSPAATETTNAETTPAKTETPTPMTPAMQPEMGHEMGTEMDACPMLAADVSVDSKNTKDGVALIFTTTSTNAADIEQLRTRVQHMADMYETHAGHGSMMWHHHRHMRAEGEQPEMGHAMPKVHAKFETIDRGAEIVLSPDHAVDLDMMREQVRDHQRRMSAGDCWMPHMQEDKAKTGA